MMHLTSFIPYSTIPIHNDSFKLNHLVSITLSFSLDKAFDKFHTMYNTTYAVIFIKICIFIFGLIIVIFRNFCTHYMCLKAGDTSSGRCFNSDWLHLLWMSHCLLLSQHIFHNIFTIKKQLSAQLLLNL